MFFSFSLYDVDNFFIASVDASLKNMKMTDFFKQKKSSSTEAFKPKKSVSSEQKSTSPESFIEKKSPFSSGCEKRRKVEASYIDLTL